MANATKYVDAAIGNDSNSGNSPGSGNAYATIGAAVGGVSGGGNVIYVKASGTYALTSPVYITGSGDGTDGRNRIEGYTTTPGARDGRPEVTSATNGVDLFQLDGSGLWEFVHIKGAHTASARGSFLYPGLSPGENNVTIEDCVCDGCSVLVNGGVRQINNLSVISTTVMNTTYGGIIGGGGLDVISECLFLNFAGNAYETPNSSASLCVHNSVFSGGSTAINDGNQGSARAFTLAVTGSLFHNLSSHAIAQANSGSFWTVYLNRNNVFWSIGGYCWNLLDSAADTLSRSGSSGSSRNNAYGSVTSGYQSNFTDGIDLTILTADPFADAANADFNLNNDAGGGAVLRGVTFDLPG